MNDPDMGFETDASQDPKIETDTSEIGGRFGDLQSLPDELLTQLGSYSPSKDDRNILNALSDDLNDAGTIDEILVALYRAENKVHERKTLATRITRMVKKGSLTRVKRGIYAVIK